jgi:hypothetical protein
MKTEDQAQSSRETRIFSIFGQIELVVAQQMAKEGKGKIIPQIEIPMSARYNEEGQLAYCAYLCPGPHMDEFENRIFDLRA